jgi:hypothetical protein
MKSVKLIFKAIKYTLTATLLALGIGVLGYILMFLWALGTAITKVNIDSLTSI